MPTSVTLKNIPDAVYERLKAAAELHRRSLNSEAIVCLESVLLPSWVFRPIVTVDSGGSCPPILVHRDRPFWSNVTDFCT